MAGRNITTSAAARAFSSAVAEGLERLKSARLFYGVACTATSANVEELMSDGVRPPRHRPRARCTSGITFTARWAPAAHPEYCLSREQLLFMRRRLLELRRKQPILIIDSYWTAAGRSVLPGSVGAGLPYRAAGQHRDLPGAFLRRRTRPAERRQPVREHQRKPVSCAGSRKFVKERTQRLRDPGAAAGTVRVTSRAAARRISAGAGRPWPNWAR